jgi:hypothetical protein
MFEKIFSWLLRLYPSHFREAYHEEALQLFCDRVDAVEKLTFVWPKFRGAGHRLSGVRTIVTIELPPTPLPSRRSHGNPPAAGKHPIAHVYF